MEVSWERPSGGAAEFEVERAQGGEDFELLETAAGEETTLLDHGLAPSTLYRYRIRACNSGGCSDPSPTARATTFALVRIATDALPDAAVAEPYSIQLTANGGDGVYSWSVIEGSLPEGLTLGSSGTISGTPEAATDASFTVEVRSTNSGSDSRELTLRVLPAAPVEIRTSRLPPALEGESYSVALDAEAGSASPEWTMAEGSLPSGLTLDSGGLLSGAPLDVGAFSLTLVAANGPESDTVDLTLEVVSHSTDSYDLTVVTLSPVSDEVRASLTAAEDRWQEVLAGDLPVSPIPSDFFDPDDCFGVGALANGTSADDMIIFLDVEGVDGPGGVLGRAAPCALRDDDPLPVVGFVSLDAADVDLYAGTSLLEDLVFHEIGHTLGFGTLWDPFLEGSGTVTPTFTGSEAVAEWHELGGSGDVPVEGGGGPGTSNSHWRESEFESEVMTGFLNQGANPVSRVTIASMMDLGYVVDLTAADSFTLPVPRPPSAPAPIAVGWDVVPEVELRRLPPGRPGP